MSFACAAAPAWSRNIARRQDTSLIRFPLRPRILVDPFVQVGENPRLITLIYFFAFPSSLILAK